MQKSREENSFQGERDAYIKPRASRSARAEKGLSQGELALVLCVALDKKFEE